MNKLELAHEYAKAITPHVELPMDKFVDLCFSYAEAMLAEDEKRKDKSRPEAIQNYEPDWSKAPEDCDWWAIDLNGQSHWYDAKPALGGNEWITGRGAKDYSESIKFVQYDGDWQNSLRKRP